MQLKYYSIHVAIVFILHLHLDKHSAAVESIGSSSNLIPRWSWQQRAQSKQSIFIPVVPLCLILLVLKSPSKTLSAVHQAMPRLPQHFHCPLEKGQACTLPAIRLFLLLQSKAGNSTSYNPPNQTMNGGANAKASELEATQPQVA